MTFQGFVPLFDYNPKDYQIYHDFCFKFKGIALLQHLKINAEITKNRCFFLSSIKNNY